MEDFLLSGRPVLPSFHFEPFIKDTHNISFYLPPKTTILDPKAALSDSSAQSTCKYFLKGTCFRGSACPFRHGKPEKSVVCKHWLRGLCKKGDHCEFLHEYNLKKMPECWFFSKYGECANADCFYLHVDPGMKVKECLWYARGFCKHGPNCRNRHVRAIACQFYLTGFCPNGPMCDLAHPKYELPALHQQQQQQQQQQPNQ